ncbi:hypothetical protein VN23_05170 [Janthinobacterium sp. B9-8]|nr:hypothetical protein VN23_05170 [Janthinobacterium sp. B9-8]
MFFGFIYFRILILLIFAIFHSGISRGFWVSHRLMFYVNDILVMSFSVYLVGNQDNGKYGLIYT